MSCPPNDMASMRRQIDALEKMLADQSGQKPNTGAGKGACRGGGKGETIRRWAWQAGPACSCQSNGGHAQEAPGCGPGFAGPEMIKATSRGPGWTGPVYAVGNGIAFQAEEALQRRAAKRRPCARGEADVAGEPADVCHAPGVFLPVRPGRGTTR
eukprot:1984310-Amphidinium_carterae.1